MEFLAGCLRSFLGCLLVVLIATIVIFLVKQQDPVNVDSNDTTVSTSTSSRKKHKKSSSSSHKHRSNSNDSDDNDTQDTYSISTPSRSNSTPQTNHSTNQQPTTNSSSTPQTKPTIAGRTHHNQGNLTANNNLLHNQQAAILGHSLIKVRKYWLPVKPTTSSTLTLKNNQALIWNKRGCQLKWACYNQDNRLKDMHLQSPLQSSKCLEWKHL